MPEIRQPKPDPQAAQTYEIRVRGHLGEGWQDWFEGLTITRMANGETLLNGPVVDQAALFGLLKRIRDLGLPLVAVQCLDDSQTKNPGAAEGEV